MSEEKIPPELKYTKSHEWVRIEGNRITVGVTDHAQSELTDIVFVDLPTVGKKVSAQASVLVLESVKTVADVYAPTEGTIAEVNTELKAHPELVNQDPYGKGWIYRLDATKSPEPSTLLSADDYRRLIGSPAH